MKLARRPTGSFLLPALALVLGVAFCGWCISLVVSVQALRQEVRLDVDVLQAISGLRETVFQLDNVALMPPAPGEAPSPDLWRKTFGEIGTRLEELGDRSQYSPVARAQIESLEAILDGVNDVGLRLTAVGLDDPARPGLRGEFVGGHQGTHKAFAAAVGAIRAETGRISADLGRKWASLNILAFLSVATVVVSILLLNRARIDAARHKESEEELRQREEQLGSVIGMASDAVIVGDHQGTIMLWNKASEEIFGYKADEAIGKSITMIVPARFEKAHQAGLDRAADKGTRKRLGQTTELTGLTKDGREFPIELSMTSWKTGKGTFFTGIVRDITERKRAETALRQSEQKFRSAFDDTAVGMALADTHGAFLEVNRAFCEMLGRTEEELCRMGFRDVTHPDDVQESVANVKQIRSGERSDFTIEKRYLRQDGEVLWALTSVAAVRDEAGRPQYLVAETQDITERKRAEERLRVSEARFRSIFEHAGAGMHTAGPDGRFRQVNPQLCAMLGYSERELLDLRVEDVTHPDDRDETAHQFGEVRAGKRSLCDLVKRLVHKNGATIWVHVTAAWLTGPDHQPLYGVALVQDITKEREAEQLLLKANLELEERVRERTAELLDTNQQLITENTERLRAEHIQRGRNRVLQALAGGAPLTEILAELLDSIEEVYPQMICSVLLVDESGKHLRLGAARRLPDFFKEAVDGLKIGLGTGTCGTAAFTGQRVIVTNAMTHAYCAAFRDVLKRVGIQACWSEPIVSSTNEVLGSFGIYYGKPQGPDQGTIDFVKSAAQMAGIAIERRKAEADLKTSQERLHVAERLTSLGTMAAGLGHDMNNILFPIRCRLDALKWDALPGDLKELLESSRDSVEYLQHLSNGLRLFAADPDDPSATVDVTSLPAWWSNVRPLITKLVPDTVRIETEIPDDVPLVGLAPHRLTQAVMNLVVNAAEAMPDGGRVRIWATSNGTAREVRIGVTDEGTGMSERVRQRALDPFFTTKTRSLSTGLGLSLVHGLVRRARGSVSIESAPGGPTTVCLILPAARAIAPSAFTDRRLGNGARERAVVTLTDQRTAAWVTNVLESMGYIVTVVGDGEPGECDIWVTEPTEEHEATAKTFLAGRPNRRIIALGPAGSAWTILGAVVVQHVTDLDAIKAAVFEVTPVQS